MQRLTLFSTPSQVTASVLLASHHFVLSGAGRCGIVTNNVDSTLADVTEGPRKRVPDAVVAPRDGPVGRLGYHGRDATAVSYT